MTAELTYPGGLIYIGILIVMVIIIAVLAVTNTNQKHEIEYLLSRRSGGKKSEAAGEEAENQQPPAICGVFCEYRDNVIPALEAEIKGWKEDYRNLKFRYEILLNTNAKLRMGRGSEDVQND